MNSQYRQKVVAVDSTYKLTGDPNNFTINLDLSQPNTFNRVSLVSGQLIKSWYTIDSDNEAFYFIEGAGAPILVSIPTGFYDQDSLATAIALEMTNNTGIGAVYAGAVNALTGKLVVTSSLNTVFILGIFIAILANGQVNSLATFMGFVGIDQVTSVSIGGVHVLTMPKNSYIERYGIVQLRCREVGNSNDTVLYNFLPTVDNGDSIYVENFDTVALSAYFRNNNNNSLNFTITDSNGILIPMNTDSQFNLIFWDDSDFKK